MSFRNDQYLPTYEELRAPELQVSGTALEAAGVYLGKHCDDVGKEFMLCRKEEEDPRKCLNENKAVSYCALDFFQKMKKACPKEFTDFWMCLDHASPMVDFRKCRKTQKVFQQCMKENMGMDVPVFGHFSKIRIHDSKRPRPRKHDIPMPPPEDRPFEHVDLDKAPTPDSVKNNATSGRWVP